MHIPQVIEYRAIGFRTRQNYEKAQWVPREKKISRYLKSRNAKLKEDAVGNLYLINKDTPLVCSHMDTVGDYEAQQVVHKIKMFQEWEKVNRINKEWKEIVNHMWSPVIVGQANIGADDKCGIAIAMELYEKLGDKISLLFTVWEESGATGINNFDEKLFEQCTYAIIPDRRGGNDLICSMNDYGSDDFEEKILEQISQFWFKKASGTFSDCDTISDYINCFNISCGYYEPHTDQEFVVVNEIENTYNALLYLINHFNQRLPKPTKRTYSWGYYGNQYGYGNEYDYYNKQSSKQYNTQPIDIDEDILYVNERVELYSASGRVITLMPWDYYIGTEWGGWDMPIATDIDDDELTDNEKLEKIAMECWEDEPIEEHEKVLCLQEDRG